MLLRDNCTHRHISDDELMAAINEASGIDELCERLRLDLCDKCKAKLEKRWERMSNKASALFVFMNPAA